MPLVYIIILNWNDFDKTIECINSVNKLTYQNFKILVVDNGSSNNSLDVISKISEIELISNGVNLGYAGGNNSAISIALERGADYVWLLNSDSTVAADCLNQLVSISEDNQNIGLLSPVIFDADHFSEVQHAVSRIDFSLPIIEETSDLEIATRWQNETPAKVIVWGTALLIPRKTISTIGVLDEQLFAYAEDTDYSVRSIKAGFVNATVFDAKIWHQGHVGLRKPHYYYYVTRNSFIFWRKHLASVAFIKVAWWNIDRTRQRLQMIRTSSESVAACLLGLWDGLCGRGGEFVATRRAPWLLQLIFAPK